MPDDNAENKTSNLHALCAKALYPIIGIFIRAGIPYDNFITVARRLYVQIAQHQFGIRGRKTNTSRVAMLTGLTRAKVKQEIDEIEKLGFDVNTEELDKARHTSRILLGWHTDSRFLDDDGRPQALEVNTGEINFETLYNAYSGKVVPSTSMLKELINVGAIAKLPDGRVLAVTRMYAPNQTEPAALERIAQIINDLASTLKYNLYHSKDNKPRFERIATNQLIPASKEEEFRQFLEIEGQAFLEKASNWLSEVEAKNSKEKHVRVGVGLYQIQSDPIRSKHDK